MNAIPDGAIVNFFSNGPDGRFEFIAGPPKVKASAPTPKPVNSSRVSNLSSKAPTHDPDKMRVEAFERLCLEEALSPSRIFAARAATQSESRPAKPANFSLNADEIYAARRINHDV